MSNIRTVASRLTLPPLPTIARLQQSHGFMHHTAAALRMRYPGVVPVRFMHTSPVRFAIDAPSGARPAAPTEAKEAKAAEPKKPESVTLLSLTGHKLVSLIPPVPPVLPGTPITDEQKAKYDKRQQDYNKEKDAWNRKSGWDKYYPLGAAIFSSAAGPLGYGEYQKYQKRQEEEAAKKAAKEKEAAGKEKEIKEKIADARKEIDQLQAQKVRLGEKALKSLRKTTTTLQVTDKFLAEQDEVESESSFIDTQIEKLLEHLEENGGNKISHQNLDTLKEDVKHSIASIKKELGISYMILKLIANDKLDPSDVANYLENKLKAIPQELKYQPYYFYQVERLLALHTDINPAEALRIVKQYLVNTDNPYFPPQYLMERMASLYLRLGANNVEFDKHALFAGEKVVNIESLSERDKWYEAGKLLCTKLTDQKIQEFIGAVPYNFLGAVALRQSYAACRQGDKSKQQQLLDKAIQYFDTALKTDQDPLFLINRSYALLLKWQTNPAMQANLSLAGHDIAHALKIDPTNNLAHVIHTSVLLGEAEQLKSVGNQAEATNKIQLAAKEAAFAERINVKNDVIRYNALNIAAQACVANRQFEDAARYITMAKEIDPMGKQPNALPNPELDKLEQSVRCATPEQSWLSYIISSSTDKGRE